MFFVCIRRYKGKINDFFDKWLDYLDKSNILGYGSWVLL